ncbi:MAG TPA: MiaB/RimO family radical SAM methylthiotransferase [Abditibacteriaceae bacterium]|jgi:threonylcarbamoyladenosine tRNA methylthiotransferase MtaB
MSLTTIKSFVPQDTAILTSQNEEISTAKPTMADITFFEKVTASPTAPSRRPTFALYTLGCKVNQYDSHQISRTLVQRGFQRVEFRESADLYVIDTCTVTAEADKKSRKAAGRAHRNNADAVVAVTGCAAAYAADQFRRVAPDALVLDNSRKLDLPDLAIEALHARREWADNYHRLRAETGSEPLPAPTRERAVLKIQDGCNHRCAFCIIPTVRGVSVTKSRATALSEARALVGEGARELTVTGVSMSDWGRSGARRPLPEDEQNSAVLSGDKASKNAELNSLFRAVTTIEGLERVRVSSLDPADVDDAFLFTVGHTEKICPHIHLALQSGSASTLRRMRRRYTPEMFLRAARRWREVRPDGGLTTDIIVGFPGETDAEFEETMQLAREAKFSAIHVFPYSPRAGTVAADLPDHVEPAVQKKRVAALLQLARELSAEYAQQFFGKQTSILVEKVDDAGVAEGLTPHYVKARVQPDAAQGGFAVGDIVWFTPQRWHDDELHGVACARPTEERDARLFAGH